MSLSSQTYYSVLVRTIEIARIPPGMAGIPAIFFPGFFGKNPAIGWNFA
jgi:hypothetical protein